MTRILWLTDIHLNFVDAARIDEFLESLRDESPDAVLISGDVAESHDVAPRLDQFHSVLDCPIYFVLGNHDFYFGSIREVRQRIGELCARRERLHYLSQSGAFQLAPGIGLVGHDGWADAREGDYERSYVMMNDYKLIQELAGVGKEDRWPLLKALGDESAAHIRSALPEALKQFRHVVLVTHVPPWREACWHNGQVSDDEWAPHFTCRAVGDAILEIMDQHPDHHLHVLCGHTHGEGEAHPRDHIVVLTGSAQYGRPAITRRFDW